MALELRDPWLRDEVAESLNAVVKWKSEEKDEFLGDTVRDENGWVVTDCKIAFEQSSGITKIVDTGDCASVSRSANDDESKNVQIIKVISAKTPESVLLSDGDCKIHARIASPKDEDRHKYTAFWNSDMRGLMEIRQYVTMVRAEMPLEWQVCLQINDFRYRGGLCGRLGDPIDIWTQKEVKEPLERIKRWQNTRETPRKKRSSETKRSNGTNDEERKKSSPRQYENSFATQVQSSLASGGTEFSCVEPSQQQSAGGANLQPPVEALRNSVSRPLFGLRSREDGSKKFADLMSLVPRAEKATGDTSVSEGGASKSPANSQNLHETHSTPSDARQSVIAANGQVSDTPLDDNRSITSPSQQEDTVAAANETHLNKPQKWSRPRVPSVHSGDFTFAKYMPQAWHCPDDQSRLLNDPACWQYPMNGLEAIKSNMPISILKELQTWAEDCNYSIGGGAKVETQSGEGGKKAARSLQEANVEVKTWGSALLNEDGGTESGDDSEEPFASWENTPSPCGPAKNAISELPPDSDVEKEIDTRVKKIPENVSYLPSERSASAAANSKFGTGNSDDDNDDSSDIEIAPPQILSSQPTQQPPHRLSPPPPRFATQAPKRVPDTFATSSTDHSINVLKSSPAVMRAGVNEEEEVDSKRNARPQTPPNRSQGAEHDEALSELDGGEEEEGEECSGLVGSASKEASQRQFLFSKRKSELLSPLKLDQSRGKRAKRSPDANNIQSDEILNPEEQPLLSSPHASNALLPTEPPKKNPNNSPERSRRSSNRNSQRSEHHHHHDAPTTPPTKSSPAAAADAASSFVPNSLGRDSSSSNMGEEEIEVRASPLLFSSRRPSASLPVPLLQDHDGGGVVASSSSSSIQIGSSYSSSASSHQEEDWFKDGQTPFNIWAQRYKSLKSFGGSLLLLGDGQHDHSDNEDETSARWCIDILASDE